MPAKGFTLKRGHKFCLFALTVLLAACGDGDGSSAVGARPTMQACLRTQAPIMAPAPAPAPSMALRLEPINASLAFPLFLTAPPVDTNRLFVVEKGGVIRILDRATGLVRPTPFLNLAAEVTTIDEQGLLGLAFHPDFAQNSFFYVNLVTPAGFTEIRRYKVSLGNPDQAETSSTLVIRVDQHLPDGSLFSNHKAGWLGFGSDRYLYVALGDGGSGGDPTGRAQNLDSLLGKILRLDVDADGFPADPTRNYAIPADNPCLGQAGVREEIWSIGLRNPWRASFDRSTGDFYIADVGQSTREEVNVSTFTAGAGRGINYGWNVMEGSLCIPPASTCSMTSLTLPAVDYAHAGGACSITGGYVYRGTAVPGLQGTYFYADFCAGFVRSFRLVNGMVREHAEWPALARGNITSFGEDAAGELYIMTSGGGLFRIAPN